MFIYHPNFDELLSVAYNGYLKTIDISVSVDTDTITSTYLFLATAYVLSNLTSTQEGLPKIPEWAKIEWHNAKNIEGVQYKGFDDAPRYSPEKVLHSEVDKIMWEDYFPIKIENIPENERYNRYAHWNSNLFFKYVIQNESVHYISKKIYDFSLKYDELPSDMYLCNRVAKKMVDARKKILGEL